MADQARDDCFYCVVDLHAMTVSHNPEELSRATLEMATLLLAAGIDPEQSTLFIQSQVGEHTRLAWLLECTATMGELNRMTQFKEKGRGRSSVSVGLFTYPVLMAADILLYDTDKVPVGDDQRQHLELTRDLAERFNSRFGETFVVPEAAVPKVGARVMDLQEPTRKMSKSESSPLGIVGVLDDPDTIRRKFARAVTDSEAEVRYDPNQKPGVSNLLEILAAITGEDPSSLAGRYDRYAPLKQDAAEAVIELLSPLQKAHSELAKDQAQVLEVLRRGAAKAKEVAQDTYARAAKAVGILT